jgi:hypothetical protein
MMALFAHRDQRVNRRQACAELITRASFALAAGHFEMEFDSGRIHFKTNLPFVSSSTLWRSITRRLFERTLRSKTIACDHATGTWMQTFGVSSAAQAGDQVEFCPSSNGAVALLRDEGGDAS